MKTGIELIADERERQVVDERWTSVHDDTHTKGELIDAARCYLLTSHTDGVPWNWPWDGEWWKPKDTIQNLIKAGALIAAEIDRLQRKTDG